MKFNDFKLSAQVIEGVEAMGFESPTPVQEQAIPKILEGKDIIACAQTGTGKTAAYLLPVISRITEQPHDGIDTLIIVPTRELASQIDQELQGFSYFTNVVSCPVYGGGSGDTFSKEQKALSTGSDIIIATPGRMLSHLALGYAKFDNLRHLILDEADRMLDMGFYEDIMRIVSYLPAKRQNLLFSATMPPKIRTMASKLLTDPAQVNIAISKPAEGVLQAAYMVYDQQKPALIAKLLKGKDLSSVIVFTSTKRDAGSVVKELLKEGLNAREIHSDLDQKEREEVLRDFRNRKFQIMVATDILARGIDIKGINLVINYNVPRDAEDYVHRIGRTARADATGVAITLINDKEQREFQRIEQLIEKEIPKLPLPPEIGEGPKPGRFSGRKEKRSGGRSFHKKRKPGS